MAKRTNRSGSLEKHGGYWLARWMVDGKRYTRSTGCKVSGGKSAKKAAEAKLKEFTHDYTLKDEKLILEKQVARLEGVEEEIEQEEAKKPAEEYAQFLLTGTPKDEREAITAARKWLYRFYYRTKRDGEKTLSAEAQKAIAERRELAKQVIRDPVRGTTYNKHLNALTLIWRHVARHEKARRRLRTACDD